jgi:alpha-L-fucosidase
MRKIFYRTMICALLILTAVSSAALFAQRETLAGHDARMQWWREARFGLFLHWGLYAIPAGAWNGQTNYGEWIRNNARIPIGVYDQFVQKFNPTEFNAGEWVRLAKNAGMKYIVITSKHHDGFCLFDSRYTDFDVMSTPFKRDILKELSEACRKEGIKLGFYYSIMDWHHPDYLPRRDWETDRPAAGAVFDRYVQYMKNQLKELLTNYGPIGVLWFDGEWESTWTETRGRDLYQYVRSLQPNIIINNRVGASRSGMEGFSADKESAGDFGTPEQQIPATGLPGLDWETCMTMNDNWGYNSRDENWKSAKDLIRMVVDIASKGGNFLLNVGPTAEGGFPIRSLSRLTFLGMWLGTNGESIYGTQSGPFRILDWGRCTQKPVAGGTRLFLAVFDWPTDRRLVVPGIFNTVKQAYVLSDPAKAALPVTRREDALAIEVPGIPPQAFCSVVVLDVEGKADISNPPEIKAEFDIFMDALDVTAASDRENVEVRYTVDGSVPSTSSPVAKGPIHLTGTAVVSARCFRDGRPVSGPAQAKFSKVNPRPAAGDLGLQPGLTYKYYEGDWDMVPDFSKIKPVNEGLVPVFGLSKKKAKERYGFEFTGVLRIPKDGVYALFLESDDGSRLYIGDDLVVDNDGLHGLQEKRGLVALAAGVHPVRVGYFNKTGSDGLAASIQGPGLPKTPVAEAMLSHRK